MARHGNQQQARAAHGAHGVRRQRRVGVKHEALFRAASRAFNRNGITSTSLTEIATELGLTPAALYHYVESKADLVYQCQRRGVDQVLLDLDRAESQGRNSLEVLELLVRSLIRDIQELELVAHTELGALEAEQRDELLLLNRVCDERIRTILRRGVREGSIADCDVETTECIIMGALGSIPRWLGANGEETHDEVSEAFLALFIRGLDPRAPLKAGLAQ